MSKMTHVTKSVSTAQCTCTTVRGVDYMYVNSTVHLYHTRGVDYVHVNSTVHLYTLRGIDYMHVNSTVHLYHTKRCGLHLCKQHSTPIPH